MWKLKGGRCSQLSKRRSLFPTQRAAEHQVALKSDRAGRPLQRLRRTRARCNEHHVLHSPQRRPAPPVASSASRLLCRCRRLTSLLPPRRLAMLADGADIALGWPRPISAELIAEIAEIARGIVRDLLQFIGLGYRVW